MLMLVTLAFATINLILLLRLWRTGRAQSRAHARRLDEVLRLVARRSRGRPRD